MPARGDTADAPGCTDEAAELGADVSGHFYAMAHPRRLVGPMDVQVSPGDLLDTGAQEAAFAAIESITRVSFPDSVRG